MATAVKIERDYEINLTLSRAESRTLSLILSCVNGLTDKSARKYVSAILDSLEECGVECSYDDKLFDHNGMANEVTLTSKSLEWVEGDN